MYFWCSLMLGFAGLGVRPQKWYITFTHPDWTPTAQHCHPRSCIDYKTVNKAWDKSEGQRKMFPYALLLKCWTERGSSTFCNTPGRFFLFFFFLNIMCISTDMCRLYVSVYSVENLSGVCLYAMILYSVLHGCQDITKWVKMNSTFFLNKPCFEVSFMTIAPRCWN